MSAHTYVTFLCVRNVVAFIAMATAAAARLLPRVNAVDGRCVPVLRVFRWSPVCPSRYMYWTDWGEKPRIEGAGMDGSNRYGGSGAR